MTGLKISVVIPARDAAATLPATLQAIERQIGASPEQVIVVDDGSSDATSELAEQAGAHVIRGGGGGPAAARNLGAAAARGELLAFTDADCTPEPQWLAAGARAIAAGAELVQGRVWPPPDAAPGPFDRSIWVAAETGLYETANLFVTRALFERLGGFESWLRPRNGIELGEDVLFGWRARRAARTAFADDAVVRHVVTPRSAAGFVAERARLRFFPALARRIPELRSEVFYRRVFLNRRSAAFDLAAAGVLVGLASRRAVPTLLALPYLLEVARDARGWGPRLGPRRGLALIGADTVGAAALLTGSVRYRSPLF